MTPSPEEVKQAELAFLLRDITNKLYLASKIIGDRETATRFNAEASEPLMLLRRRWAMPSGNTIRVPRPKP